MTTAPMTSGGPFSSVPPVPAEWRVTPEGTVPVVDVGRTVGDYGAIDHAIRRGGVRIVSQGGAGRRRHISLADAVLLFAVATLAAAAGVAISQLYLAVKASGARVDGGAVVLPLGKVA